MSERSDKMWRLIHLLAESGTITTSAEKALGGFANNLCDADAKIKEIEANAAKETE